jgi:hypothetical protein
MVDDGHGKTHGRFTLPTLHGDILRTHLMALANPRRRPPSEDASAEPRQPAITPQRLGEAFMEYLECYPANHLPRHGGTDATIAVTITLHALLTGLGAATLPTGHQITAGEARRLACRADILPAILGTDSEVLDLGHARRLFTGPSRTALDLRDQGCTTLGCDLPPAVCHAHHDQPWSRGGPTNPANGRLLCPQHHRLAHDPATPSPTTPTTRSTSTAAREPTGLMGASYITKPVGPALQQDPRLRSPGSARGFRRPTNRRCCPGRRDR